MQELNYLEVEQVGGGFILEFIALFIIVAIASEQMAEDIANGIVEAIKKISEKE